MPFRFNPFTGNLDEVDASAAAGSNTQVQVNDGGKLAGFIELLWNKVTKVFTVKGDINLDDGGTFATTLQPITPTANRTISFPDATGTVGLVGGSSGQVIYNNAGAYAGVSTMTFDGTSVTLAGRLINSYTSLASSPAKVFTGTWFAGGTATTTKPHFLIEPTGTTSTAWSTSGTGLGINAASGFTGNLLDLQVNGTSKLRVTSRGDLGNVGAAIYTTTVALYGTGSIEFASPVNTNIYGEAANTLAQRNGTNAQTLRVYGTYTNLSNHVRGSLSATSTAVTLAAETAGTSAGDIPLNLTAAGRGTVKVNSVAEVAVSSTVAGLPASPAVGMLTRVTDASAPAVGSTVAGGGAAAALVWWNGTNWTVIGV